LAAVLINGSIARKEAGGGEAVEAEDEAVAGLADVEDGFAKDAVFGRPVGGVGTPVDIEAGLIDVEGVDDEGGAGEVAGRADDLGGVQFVLVHDAGGVVDVLDGVLGLHIFEDYRCGDAFAPRQLRHHIGFYVLVVGGGAGHDDVRSDAGLIFADAFEDALALLGRWGAVGVGRVAEYDERVEVGGASVVRGDGKVDAHREEDDGEDSGAEIEEDLGKDLHGDKGIRRWLAG
jgi:hypothetical protein